MDPEMVARITTSVAIVLGGGAVLAPLVSYGVNVIKRMMTNRRRRRVVLPLAGLLLGWIATSLVLVLLRMPMSLETVALALLTGFCASLAADNSNAKAKEAAAREDGRG